MPLVEENGKTGSGLESRTVQRMNQAVRDSRPDPARDPARIGRIVFFFVINAIYCQTAEAAETAGAGSFLNMALQSIAALAAVLGLFAIVIWLMRRFQAASSSHVGEGGRLRIVQRLPLGGKHSLAIIAYGQEQWLIALSPDRVARLSRLGESESLNAEEQKQSIE